MLCEISRNMYEDKNFKNNYYNNKNIPLNTGEDIYASEIDDCSSF